jgi:hypothetical protein
MCIRIPDEVNMKPMTPRKLMLWVLLGVLTCCAILLGVLFASLQSPALLTRLARVFGYDVSVESISISPRLSGSVSGLSVKSLRDGGTLMLAANVTVKNSLDMLLQGEIEQLELQHPKFSFRLGGGPGGDLSLLEKLPNIRSLIIRDAEAQLAFEGGHREVRLSSANLTIRDFSSKTGGGITFQTHLDVTAGGESTMAASGTIKGDLQLTGMSPRPYGKGTLELALDSGRYTSGDQTVSLGGLTLATDLAYDQRSDTFAITALRGGSQSLGSITGTARAVLRGEWPWRANLSATSIDLAQVYALIRPFLPEAYAAWTVQGRGGVETEVQGTYAKDQLAFNGNVAFMFSQGGFSSPDGTKAAQGMNGKIVLKLQRAAAGQTLSFNLSSEGQGGEYLWGGYYNNLADQRASLVADGSLQGQDHRQFLLQGRLDFFQTGDYSFGADGTANEWTVRVKAANVSHARLVQAILGAHLRESLPKLATLSVTGTSSLDATVRHQGAATAITGGYRMTDTTLTAPDVQATVQDLAVSLPFDLRYPSTGESPASAAESGFLRVRAVHSNRLTLENLQIPLQVAQNKLEMPEPVTVPFFGGKIQLYGVQIDDLLSPSRYRFGVKIDGVDLGRLTLTLMGTEYAGTIDADLGVMRYENNRLESEGTAKVRVFGGEVEASNFFAENLALPSRRLGGDITFRNISLEELTKKIDIGKVSGVIQGFLKHFVVEYGQPASFDLEVESVDVAGVSQWISLEAIQSISILGTGASSGLNTWITQMFKKFPYSRIGIRCDLTNDQFSVRGTIHEDGKEYLVRRGILRGVDVVNQNPENVISFKDMAERIDRVWASQAEPGQIRVE